MVKKSLITLVLILIFVLLSVSTVVKAEVVVLDDNVLYNIRGLCPGGLKCNTYSHTVINCDCYEDEYHEIYYECSVKKDVLICGYEPPIVMCTNGNSYKGATSSTYSGWESHPGRKCNAADYCYVTGLRGVDYIGPGSPCYVYYYGCN